MLINRMTPKGVARSKAGQSGQHLRAAGILVAVFAACASSAAAFAATCPLPKGASPMLGSRDTAARAAYLRDSMAETARMERRFVLGWSLAYVGMASGTWLLVPFSSNPGQRVASAWNSATSLAGGLQLLVKPLRILRSQRRLEALLSQPLPHEQECSRLAEAERLFAAAAKSELGAKAPLSHILSFFTNIGLGLILGYGLKQPSSAAFNIPLGVIIAELQIATRPSIAARRLEGYLAGSLSSRRTEHSGLPLQFTAVSLPIDGGYGAALLGAF